MHNKSYHCISECLAGFRSVEVKTAFSKCGWQEFKVAKLTLEETLESMTVSLHFEHRRWLPLAKL